MKISSFILIAPMMKVPPKVAYATNRCYDIGQQLAILLLRRGLLYVQKIVYQINKNIKSILGPILLARPEGWNSTTLKPFGKLLLTTLKYSIRFMSFIHYIVLKCIDVPQYLFSKERGLNQLLPRPSRSGDQTSRLAINIPFTHSR